MGIYTTNSYKEPYFFDDAVIAPIEEKEEEYTAYIKEHIININTVFEEYGELLSKALSIKYSDLKKRVSEHDNSKFHPAEFEGYRQYFYPTKDEEKDENAFKKSWLFHVHLNDHHPEHWILVDGDKHIIFDMDKCAIAEMLLDWAAMGIRFNDTAYDYYMENRDNKPLSENTKKIVDEVIHIFK